MWKSGLCENEGEEDEEEEGLGLEEG